MKKKQGKAKAKARAKSKGSTKPKETELFIPSNSTQETWHKNVRGGKGHGKLISR